MESLGMTITITIERTLGSRSDQVHPRLGNTGCELQDLVSAQQWLARVGFIAGLHCQLTLPAISSIVTIFVVC